MRSSSGSGGRWSGRRATCLMDAVLVGALLMTCVPEPDGAAEPVTPPAAVEGAQEEPGEPCGMDR